MGDGMTGSYKESRQSLEFEKRVRYLINRLTGRTNDTYPDAPSDSIVSEAFVQKLKNKDLDAWTYLINLAKREHGTQGYVDTLRKLSPFP